MTVKTDRPPTEGQASGRKTFRMFDMVLFSVAAMLLLSQVTVTAAVGPTTIFWTVAIIIMFFIPYGLVTSELGSAYPDAGGIYAWVVRAFGNRWGSRVSWWYWLNVGLWVPSVYLLFSGAISSMFFGGNLNFWVQVAITVTLIWVNFWVNARSLKTGTWVSNVGAGITIAVIVAVAIAGGVYASAHGSATSWTMSSVIPTDALPAFIAALPIVIYNFLGFELMSSASTQMENPKRDVPRTIAIAGVLIGGFYLIATVGMQLILPADQISKTTGLVDALRHGFGDSAIANVVVTALGIGALFCFFASLVPWTIGANIAASEAAQQGDLPPVFAKTHATRGTPVGAAMLCSIVGTVFTLGYAALFSLTGGSIDQVFWNLFAFSSVIFLLPYIVMMLAFGKLRRLDPKRPRPYRVPGGAVMTWIITWVPTALLAAAAVFFICNPYNFSFAVTGSILLGLVVTVGIQEYFCLKSPEWTRLRALERGEDPDTAVQFADVPQLDPEGSAS